MLPSIARPIARRPAILAVAALLAVGFAAPAASAQSPGTAVTVSPSTGLLDGEVVEVHATGYAPVANLASAQCDTPTPVSLSDCDLATASFSAWTDASGAATFTQPLRRLIVTDEGPRDCAVEACYLGVTRIDFPVPDFSTAATAPVAFAEGPTGDGATITLVDPAYLDADPVGAGTVPATVTCETHDMLTVQFRIWQDLGSGSLTSVTSSILVECVPGTPLRITSDLMGTAVPAGPATLLVRVSPILGSDTAWLLTDIQVASNADAVAALLARLADPEDTTVLADFTSTLLFRLEHNPIFAQAFWRAVLAAT
jgi:hypothetical protein